MHCRKLLVSFIILACVSSCNVFDENREQTCNPPEEVHEMDLIGTWTTGLSERNDTLILYDDGTYKQIIHVENPLYDYESQLNNWWIEVSTEGITYLHLEGMQLCVYWSKYACGETYEEGVRFFDYCKNEWVTMLDTGILLVLGPPEGFDHPSDQMRLVSLQKSTHRVTAYSRK